MAAEEQKKGVEEESKNPKGEEKDPKGEDVNSQEKGTDAKGEEEKKPSLEEEVQKEMDNRYLAKAMVDTNEKITQLTSMVAKLLESQGVADSFTQSGSKPTGQENNKNGTSPKEDYMIEIKD